MPNQDTDGNRMIWDETLRQWVPVTGSLSPAELANEINPILSSRFAPRANVRYVDQFDGATVADKIDAAIADLDGDVGLVVIPSNLGAGEPSAQPTNATLWDLRGGLPVDGGVAINARTAGVADRMRIHQWTTDPDRSVVALDCVQDVSGAMHDPSSAEGLTGQVRLRGSLTNSPTSGFALVGVEGNTTIMSTGNTVARARGGTFNVYTSSGSTTNVTDLEVIVAQTAVRSGTGTITNCIGILAEDQSVGSTLNYSLSVGHMLIRNNRNVDALDSTGTARRLLTVSSGDLVLFRPLSDTVGFRFGNQANSASWLTLTSTAAAIGLPLTVTGRVTADGLTLGNAEDIRLQAPAGDVVISTDASNQLNIQGPTVQTRFLNAAYTAVNLAISDAGNITHRDGGNLVFGTTTGSKIGTSTSQKLGFFNATPVVQPSGTPAAATDLATAITLVNSLRTNLLALGLVA